jgi:hypothetical protein
LLGPDFARVLPVVDQLLQVTRGLLRLVELGGSPIVTRTVEPFSLAWKM